MFMYLSSSRSVYEWYYGLFKSHEHYLYLFGFINFYVFNWAIPSECLSFVCEAHAQCGFKNRLSYEPIHFTHISTIIVYPPLPPPHIHTKEKTRSLNISDELTKNIVHV